MTIKNAWTPEGFERYIQHFPNTEKIILPKSQNLTAQFCDLWNSGSEHMEQNLKAMDKDITFIFVRGYLGRYLPNSFKAPVNLLKSLGFDAAIMQQRAGGSQQENVQKIQQQLKRRENRSHFIFCAHSRGGLECLNLLKEDEQLHLKTKALIMSQTAHGFSHVLESMLHGAYQKQNYSKYRSLCEKIQKTTLSIIRAKIGGEELTSKIWPKLVKAVEQQGFNIPILQTASWSTQPTMWLDSFHERLNEIRPAYAHDGQFFLNDLIWPHFDHVLLPHLDHAQPVVGGFNFNHTKYWLTLISMINRVNCNTVL